LELSLLSLSIKTYRVIKKVSVHLMITTQKVASNVQSVSRQSSFIYWHAELCSTKTVFSTARSTFRMYSVMANFKSSVVWGF